MTDKFLKSLLLIVICFVAGVSIHAQSADSDGRLSRGSGIKDDDFPEGFRESLAKRRIKAEQEEFQELIDRGEEAVKISDEVYKSFEAKKNLTAEDSKKIERLEKVVKKIRQDLGAEDDSNDDKIDKPSSLQNTLTNIKETTSDLLTELKKTTRHSISVIAIQSSNSLLKLVRFAKFSKN
jgi:membrane-associated HD superfamily phosphohydrolase